MFYCAKIVYNHTFKSGNKFHITFCEFRFNGNFDSSYGITEFVSRNFDGLIKKKNDLSFNFNSNNPPLLFR